MKIDASKTCNLTVAHMYELGRRLIVEMEKCTSARQGRWDDGRFDYHRIKGVINHLQGVKNDAQDAPAMDLPYSDQIKTDLPAIGETKKLPFADMVAGIEWIKTLMISMAHCNSSKAGAGFAKATERAIESQLIPNLPAAQKTEAERVLKIKDDDDRINALIFMADSWLETSLKHSPIDTPEAIKAFEAEFPSET